MGGGGKECPPTRVVALFVTLPPPRRCHHTDAEAYKECLDAYLEGLIAGGSDLSARLLERKARDHVSDDHRDGRTPSFTSKAGVNLCPPWARPSAAGGDSSLQRAVPAKLGCMQFVDGPGATSSRGSRRRGQDGAAWVENLSNVAVLLLLRHPVEKTPSSLAM
jgi:hypothetical protein